MEKIELKIIDIKDSVANKNYYNVVLKEKTGRKGIIIVIGYAEAQSIAVALDEDIQSSRPLTHDLFFSVCRKFDIEVVEVLINKVIEGVFHSILICKNGNNDIVEIDSRTSDAMAISLRFKCPIYIKRSILNEIGSDFEASHTQTVEEFEEELQKELESLNIDELTNVEISMYAGNTITELEEMLNQALHDEDYEKAARIRDEISKRKP